MKKLLYLFLTVLIAGCGNEDDNPCDSTPSFSNIIISNVSYTSFDLNGTITPSSCDSNVITQGIVYSTNELPTQSNNSIVFSDNTYTETITDLSLQTTYYIRPFFENQDGVFYGNQVSVTTLSSSISFSNISHTASIASVLISANYSFDNGEGVSTISKGVIIDGTQYEDSDSPDGSISLNIENLEPNTNYTYSVFVINEFGTSQSDSSGFQTDNASSVVSNLNISSIDFTSADFSATYKNLYSGEDVTLDKGVALSLDEDFQNQTFYSSSSDSGVIDLSVSNLAINTTYFARAFVENEFGINYGGVAVFETLSLNYTNTYTINNVGYDFANININYTQVSGEPIEILEKGIEIVDMPSYNVIDSTSPDGQISLELPDLTHNTNYSFIGYLTTQYGKYYFDSSIELNTLDATPSITSSVSNITLNSTSISTTFNFAPETNNSLVRIVLENGGNIQYITLDNVQINQETQLDNLSTNTNYSYSIEVTNQYGSYSSSTYQFLTLDDEPEIDFSYTLTGENQITLTGLITPANNGENIISIFIQYKNNEEDNYQTIGLSTSNFSISEALDDLVQGPNYNFKLVVITDYNTFEEDLYYNLPVTYEVGDTMLGGIVGYIDSSGYHGYIISEFQYSVYALQWATDQDSSDELRYLNAYACNNSCYTDGEENTQIIVDFFSGISASAPAAEYCNNLNINGYDDWFLGSHTDNGFCVAEMYSNGWPGANIWDSNTYYDPSWPDYDGAAAASPGSPNWGPKDYSGWIVWPIRKF